MNLTTMLKATKILSVAIVEEVKELVQISSVFVTASKRMSRTLMKNLVAVPLLRKLEVTMSI